MEPQLSLAGELGMGKPHGWNWGGWNPRTASTSVTRDTGVGVIILCTSPFQNKNERCRKSLKSKQNIRLPLARGSCQAHQVSGKPSHRVAPGTPDGAPCVTADDGSPLLSPCLVTHQTVWATGWST